MAEVILSGVVQQALVRLLAEIVLPSGFQHELRRLDETVTEISAVLMDAEEKRFTSHSVGLWLRQLRDGLFEAEDVLDYVAYEVLRKQILKSSPTFSGMVYSSFDASSIIALPLPLVPRLGLGLSSIIRLGNTAGLPHRMKEIRKRLAELNANRAAFHFVARDDHDNLWRNRWRETAGAVIINRSVVMGREDHRETVLKNSYDGLPYELKQCFLYFSFFPEGYVFRDYSLISFWMAHGLLQSEDNSHRLEDVGKEYIDEFLSRGFFKGFLHVGAWMCTFKLNDFVAELARSLSEDEFQIIDEDHEDLSENVRHVWFEEQLCLPNYDRRIRSVIVPQERLGSSKALSDMFLPRFKSLRFLLLANSELEKLPNCVGTLKHLRSLDLEGCRKMKKLPNSICRLHNLDSLSLKGCAELEELPKNIGDLVNLRWLCVTTRQKYLPKNGIETLASLRFLWFSCCPNLESLFVSAQMETRPLQTLVVEECNSLKSLFRASGSANSLIALEVLDLASCEKLNLNEELLPSLKSLGISALLHLEVLPDWIQERANTLSYLEIKECHNLGVLPEWLPSLGHLTKLKINGCPRLSSLPEGMNNLSDLKDLEITGCGQLSERCKGGGEEWSKISHVPNIKVD